MESSSDEFMSVDAGPDHGDEALGPRSSPEKTMPHAAPQMSSRPQKARGRPDLAPLARTIEAEIIPRLMLLHREAPIRGKPHASLRPKSQAIPNVESPVIAERFLRIILDERVDAAVDYVDDLLIADVPFEDVALGLLAPTARKLGRLWEEDVVSFVEVTIAMTRLQKLIRVYAPSLAPEYDPTVTPWRILISAVPGEKHTFGASVAEALFVKDGWDVQAEVGLGKVELLERIRTEWFDVVGLTASSDASISQLSALIRRIREASLNSDLKILLGGAAFLGEPSMALALGADIEACSGPDVVGAVNEMMKGVLHD